MGGRLTLKKVNADVGDMATYADANAQLISASKSKVCKNPFYVISKKKLIVFALTEEK